MILEYTYPRHERKLDTPMELLTQTTHRPWPLPKTPWLMTQFWDRLLFAHWPLPPEALRPLIPPV